VPLAVVGILPAEFAGLSGKARAWILPSMAARLTYSDYLTTPQHFISVVARLKPDVRLSQANAELASIGSRFADTGSATTATWSATAVPINEARIDSTVRRSAILLFAAAAGVLLIACLNVACLLLARAQTRRREIAVRLAIGASRQRIVRQLLTEGFVTAAIAGAAGCVLAVWEVAAFARTAPGVIATSRNDYGALASFAVPHLDLTALAFAVAVSAASTVLFSLTPALEASRPQLTTAIKEADRARRGRALGMLVATEVALAVMLLAAAGLLIDAFADIQRRRTGFDPDRVLTFWLRPPNSRYQPADGPAILERLLTRIQSVPGVESAAVNRCTPFTGCSRTTIFFPDRTADGTTRPVVGRHYVSADYFKTLSIPLRSGRTLTDSDRAGAAPVTVVNETAARRFWPGENPIGHYLWFGSSTGFTDPSHPVEVVGVVGDVKYEGVDQPVGPDFYTSYLQFSYPDSLVLVRTRGAAAALIPALRRAVASVDRSVPLFDALLLDDRIDAAVARPRFNASLLGAFAFSALLLASVGVYGVQSYAVAARTREIGVRLALGADSRRVLGLVLRDAGRFVAAGAVAGAASALALSRLLEGLVVGVGSWNSRVLAISVATMVALACLAALLPARRATTIDPLVVLRSE
jgi:predicted permease